MIIKSRFIKDLTCNPERIMRFIKYAFHIDKIGSNMIFKIIDHPKSDAFVTQQFIDYIKGTDITGLTFKLVWDSADERVN